MKEKYLYGVMAVKESLTVEVLGQQKELSFKDAGFRGMIPVFNTEKEAKEYANGKFQVFKVQFVELK